MIRRRVIITDGLMGQDGRETVSVNLGWSNFDKTTIRILLYQWESQWLGVGVLSNKGTLTLCLPLHHYTHAIILTPLSVLHLMTWLMFLLERKGERERGSKAPLALSNLGYPGYITCIHTIHTAPTIQPSNHLSTEHLH